MHDRRIGGLPHSFGNYGPFYRGAMTLWDHRTESVWSQPTGRAITGPYKGLELALLPSQLATWSSWKQTHSRSQVMITDYQSSTRAPPSRFGSNFVIGVKLAGRSKGFNYEDVISAGVINDSVGEIPVLIWADEDSYFAYVRLVAGRELSFQANGVSLVDPQTGSTWDPARGLAVSGPLQGTALRPAPSMTAYEWAWHNFQRNADTLSR